MFKTKILALIFLTLGSYGSFAQEVFKFNSAGGGFNFVSGIQIVNSDAYFEPKSVLVDGSQRKYWDLANRSGVLKDAADNEVRSRVVYGRPGSTLITAGFQGFGVVKSLIIGGELNFGYGASAGGDQYDTTITVSGSLITRTPNPVATTTARFGSGDVLLNVGLVALRKRGLIIYPLIGVGYGASGLWLQSNSATRLYPEAAEVVSRSDRNLQNMFIWTRSTVLDFGLGMQYMLGASTEDRAKGFSLGIRVGYKTQLATDNVLVNGNKNAADSYPVSYGNPPLPQLGLGGAYVKLLIGFGRVGESN